jgi:hypothetical protein
MAKGMEQNQGGLHGNDDGTDCDHRAVEFVLSPASDLVRDAMRDTRFRLVVHLSRGGGFQPFALERARQRPQLTAGKFTTRR